MSCVTAPSTEDAVCFRHVYKAFIAREQQTKAPMLAREDVSFSAAPGEFVSLIGPSGCGKSTCLNLVAGLDMPSSGVAEHHGKAVRGVNTRIGYITQHDNLLPWRSLLANVELGLEFKKVPREERRRRRRSSQLVRAD